MSEATDTKERILDTAERLFAERGLGQTSLRQITSQAEVNLAAVNYHFGSKEGLIKAVLARRLEPLNRERIRRLDRLERSGDLTLEGLIEAFIGPPLELSRDGAGGGRFVRLMGRTYTEHANFLHDHMRQANEGLVSRFKPAFREVLPELPKGELYWRLHFMVGVMSYVMAGNDMMQVLAASRGANPDDPQEIIRRMVPFLAGGLQAPLPPELQQALEEGAAEAALGSD
ncbi:TetR family transcriptional regulator [Alkalispirillum mobile]|uniref:TetR family transcriptional regulator n=1 Tax=Alkalispirillum mobile TaxID=85925 RepID=A0A498BVC7_9GAMM|nr:TetR/AcrR family transcriptional regulator [Alkalispirillum mobile]RLK46817.1 TetR family transcriptional regulator [Alkalispirillum mobile]